MRVAVLSLTRDRLWATRHCFASLHKYAGCEFSHYVYDQASQDGTQAWLETEYRPHFLWCNAQNVGISKGINFLLDACREQGPYDVIVKFDNDCELTTPDTLKACAEVAMEGWISSPHIQGLNSPPSIERETMLNVGSLTGGSFYRVGVPNIMGGIFMAAPASLYDTYRHDPANPVWGMDDAKIVPYWRDHGGEVGYLFDYPAWHHLGTEGQKERDAAYYARKAAEFV